ncbi:MAG: hypothetical protein ACP5OU_09605 [Methanothrix sp.]
MKIPILFIISFLLLSHVVPSDSLMQFQYKCIGTNATLSTYSYLKEPRIEETGYMRGLKSSSFNYLKNGSIDLEENIKYFYGNGTNITNTSIDHSLKVDFDGKMGISEFFAKGFFGNNRWISAWKKIRYEVSPSVKINGEPMENRPANDIVVDASVVMDTKDNNRTNYRFNYNAEIKNGVMEAKDATGWTNRTGAKRYDWTYEALTSGKELSITNNLFDSERIVPAAGPIGDWLPCWCKGTMPAIEQLDEPWPSFLTKKILDANRILPTAQLSPVNSTFDRFYPTGISISGLRYRRSVAKKHVMVGNIGLMDGGVPLLTRRLYIQHSAPKDISFNCSNSNRTDSAFAAFYPESRNVKVGLVTYLPEAQLGPLEYNLSHKVVAKTDCTDGDCPGFEGMYTYDEGPTAMSMIAAAEGEVPELTVKNIDVTSDVFEIDSNTTQGFEDANSIGGPSSPAKHEMYKITVHNSGSVALSDVILSAELAKGIKPVNASYYEAGRGILEVTSVPEKFNENVMTTLTFKLNTMSPGEVKSVLIEAYAKKDVDKTRMSVEVKGKAPDGDELRDSQNSADIQECRLMSKQNPTRDECSPYAALKDKASGKNEYCVEVCPDWRIVK